MSESRASSCITPSPGNSPRSLRKHEAESAALPKPHHSLTRLDAVELLLVRALPVGPAAERLILGPVSRHGAVTVVRLLPPQLGQPARPAGVDVSVACLVSRRPHEAERRQLRRPWCSGRFRSTNHASEVICKKALATRGKDQKSRSARATR